MQMGAAIKSLESQMSQLAAHMGQSIRQQGTLPSNTEKTPLDSHEQCRAIGLRNDREVEGASGSTSVSTNPMSKHRKLDDSDVHQAVSSNCQSCVLEFDGASKGNPGQAGAGAVIRSGDGRVVYRLREGVGFATNNVAEYRSVILGMKHALHKGFKHIRVRGDSKLVCMQVLGLWKTKNQNMADLCKIAKELKSKFTSFEINHVDREFNSDADAQANIAVHLKDGQVQEAVATT